MGHEQGKDMIPLFKYLSRWRGITKTEGQCLSGYVSSGMFAVAPSTW